MRFLMTLAMAAALPAALQAQSPCAASSGPEPLPMPMQLLDSAALTTSLPAVLPPVTFSLWYGENGQLTHVLALTDSLVVRHEAAADSGTVARAEIAATISGAAFPLDSGKEVVLRLAVARVASGGLSFGVEHSVICEPVQIHMASANDRHTLTRDEVKDVANAGSMSMTAAIDATGHVRSVTITSPSSSPASDEMRRRAWETAVFKPLMVDGFPKAINLRIEFGPIRVR